MPQTSYYHWKSKRKYPMFYLDEGDKLVLNWGGCPRKIFMEIKDDIKGCEDSRWDPEKKRWTVKHPRRSRRNAHVLGHLTNGEIPFTVARPFDSWFREPEGISPDELFPDVEYRPFQAEDLPKLLFHRRIGLGYDMGLGKTLMALSVMSYALRIVDLAGSNLSLDHQDLLWVIGPNSALHAWPSQLREWGPKLPGGPFRPQLIVNSPQSIEKAMARADAPPLVLINDESAHLKSMKAQRTQLDFELACLMADFWQGAEFVINMTGTPGPKDSSDWWSQTEIMMPGWLREKSAAKLKERLSHMGELAEGQYGNVYRPHEGWNTKEIDALAKRLAPIWIYRFKEDVAKDLPDKNYIEVMCPPKAETIAAARIIVDTEPALRSMQLCRQLSDGFLYEHELREKDDGTVKRVRTGASRTGSSKQDAVRNILFDLRANERTRVILWGSYHESIDLLTELAVTEGWAVIRVDGRGWAGIPNKDGFEPDPSQDQFQLHNLDVPIAFVANPASGGEGLTLTKAHDMVWYSKPDKANQVQQAEDRFHRIGMDTNISPNIYDLIHLPTDKIQTVQLRAKKDLQSLTRGEIISEFARLALEAGEAL
jgi:SNF2 family DNA or RNA helicase